MPAEPITRINVKVLAISVALFWGFIVLIIALGNLGLPPYGRAFLEIAASIYPGYRADATLLQVILVTVYAAIDGAIAGAVVGWLYNRIGFARKS